MTDSFAVQLAVMTAAAFLCRMAGFTLMRFVPVSPRVEAALRATPLGVMAGITALAVQAGGLAEGLALASVVGLTLVLRSDVAAALLGVVVVAGLRWVYLRWRKLEALGLGALVVIGGNGSLTGAQLLADPAEAGSAACSLAPMRSQIR